MVVCTPGRVLSARKKRGGIMNEEEDWIPLLSPMKLKDFTAEGFKNYVRGLFRKKAKKEKVIRLKKPKPPFVISLTKKGNLSFKVNRDPKWLSAQEIEGIAKIYEKPVNEVWVLAMKKKIVIVPTKEAGEGLKGRKEI
jgi:hypothetical protein